MRIQSSLTLAKALADVSRLRILGFLLDGPRCAEELAQRLDLSPSTVSFHLDKLEAAGLVESRREQYYRVFSAAAAPLDLTLRDLVAAEDSDRAEQERRIQNERRKVRAAFFENGRLVRMPAQRRKRRIVLDEFVRFFRPGVEYTEPEVNRLIHRKHPDHCLIRRLLVEEGFMSRDKQLYRRTSEKSGGGDSFSPASAPPPEKSFKTGSPDKARRRAIISAYKSAPRTAGVFQVKNRVTGRLLLGSSLNMHGPFNRIRMELETGIMRNPDLLADWNQYGPDAFSFDILETVKEDADPKRPLEERLREIEEIWIEKLQPFGEKGYNLPGRMRMA